MKTTFWIIALISSIIAGLVFVVIVSTAKGAPQEAAGAAIALCIAVIPYVLARAVSELSKK